LQCVAGCCRVLQGVAGCCRVLQGVAGCCRVLQGVAGRHMPHSNPSASQDMSVEKKKTWTVTN